MPLIIILAECGIELIPKQIRNHPSVKKNVYTRNYTSQLLDNAIHHTAMKELKDFTKRGRPDIIHLCLLNALGSALNKSGELRLFMHTVKNRIYEFNPEIRIARNYNRFKGLMAKLLIDENIGPVNSPLISLFDGIYIKELISTFEDPEVILFSSKGKLIKNYQELYPQGISKNIIVIIGGFQKSSFSREINDLSPRKISLSEFSLDAWVAIYKAITYFELTHKIK